MSVVDDLKAAKAVIEEQGWIKGTLTDGQGVCAVGALNVACFGHAIAQNFDNLTSRVKAHDALTAHLPKEFAEVWEFNDYSQTTREDVLNLFEKTIADLGGMA